MPAPYHMSDFLPYLAPRMISGAIQYGVPRTDIASWAPLQDIFLAHPKSISLTTPSGINIMLPLFISLYI